MLKFALALVICGAIGLRFFLHAPGPFFADVPNQVAAIESGRMLIQFPGYAPFHLLANSLVPFTGTAFGGLVAIGQLAAVIAILMTTALAARLAGMSGALIAASVMGFGLIPMYFSVVGASYIVDMATAAAVLYCGLRSIEMPDRRYLYLVALVLCVGAFLRPSHAVLLAPAVAYLFWIRKDVKATLVAAVIGIGFVAAYLAITIAFEPINAPVVNRGTGYVTSLLAIKLSNLVKIAATLVWGFHFWLAVIIGAVFLSLRNWRHAPPPSGRRKLLIFWGIALVVPASINFLHMPYAGYMSIVWPQLALLPFVLTPAIGSRMNRSPIPAILGAVFFIVIGLVQFFGFHPIATKDRASLAANVLLLQYSWEGIRTGMFETFSSLAARSGIESNSIPSNRLDDPRIQQWLGEDAPGRGLKQ